MTIRMASKRRAFALVATGASLALILSACADTDGGAGGRGGGGGEAEAFDTDCAARDDSGRLDGKEVTAYRSIIARETETWTASYEPFEKCTGVHIEYEASREMEAQIATPVQAGNP